jgi:hypothetical protein
MPGEETKHEPAGMQTQGLYNPTTTQLHYTPVPFANYGPMLQAIESAGSNILHYLNPSTIAKMKMDVASSDAGRQFLDQATKNQYIMASQGYVQGGQFGLQPAYENPLLRQKLAGPLIKETGGGSKTAVDPNSVPPQSGTTNNSTNNPNPNPPASNVQPWWGGQVRTGDANTDALTNPDYSRIVPSPGYSYQGYQSGGEVQSADQPPQPTNYFSPTNAIPPPPIPAQQQSPQDQRLSSALPAHIPYSPEAQAQAFAPQQGAGVLSPDVLARQQAQRQLEQQNLTSWQNQNQGGVMSAEEARNWARANLDTDINRAVYLPQGGPPDANGQRVAAFAFYGKKGGTNIVPIPQMVKAGAGPLVAAQNSSHLLSAGDQQNQPQPNQPQPQPNAQPPGGGAGAVAGGVAGASPPQVGMPPAAPSGSTPGSQVPQLPGGGTNWGAIPGQLPQDVMDQRIAAATNVPNAGGPSLGQLYASTDNPAAAVSQDFVKANTGATPEDIAQAKANLQTRLASGDSTINRDADGNPSLGKLGDFQYYQSDNGKGLAYADRDGEGGFYRDRLYEGDTQWKPTLPNANQARQDLLNTAYGKSLGMDAISKMNAQQLSDALYSDYYIHNILPSQPNLEPGQATKIEDSYYKILSGNRLIHALEGQNPGDFNYASQGVNLANRTGKGLFSPNPQGPIQQVGNALSSLLGLAAGPKKEDDRLTFVQQQEASLINRMHHKPEGSEINPLDWVAGDNELGGIGTGSANALDALKRKVSQWQVEWNNDMFTARANKSRLPGAWNDLMNDFNAGKPWFDPDDTYGPSRKKPNEIGPLAAADAAHTTLAPRVTNSPPPPAPGASRPTQGVGSSRDNPVIVHSDDDFNGLPQGTHWRDEAGNEGQK